MPGWKEAYPQTTSSGDVNAGIKPVKSEIELQLKKSILLFDEILIEDGTYIIDTLLNIRK